MKAFTNLAESTQPGVAFLTNHAHVLLLVAQNSDMRMRDVALEVGITERAVQRIVDDLAATGFVCVTKEGRCNHYSVAMERQLRHPMEKNCTVGDFLRCIAPPRLSETNGAGPKHPL